MSRERERQKRAMGVMEPQPAGSRLGTSESLASPDMGMEGKLPQLSANPCKEKCRALFILQDV